MEEPRVFVYKRKKADLEVAKRKRQEIDDDEERLHLQQRRNTFTKLWEKKEREISKVIKEANAQLVQQIDDFVADPAAAGTNTIPAGLILTGHGSSSSTSLYDQIATIINARPRQILISLESADCSNLKSLLKHLIQKATSITGVDEADEDLLAETQSSGPRRLNYDLQILKDWCAARKIDTVVVAFKDGEAFDTQVLSDTILLFKSWRDRLRFVTLFGIATSVEVFQDRLPQATIRCVTGQLFSVARFDVLLNEVCRCCMSCESDFWLGPSLIEMLVQRQVDHIQSIEGFVQAVKYAYMSHCYGNIGTIFIEPQLASNDVLPMHLEAVRNMPSFRSHAEGLLAAGDHQRVKQLLESDEELLEDVKESCATGRDLVSQAVGAADVLRLISETVRPEGRLDVSLLFRQCLSGELQSSTATRDLMLLVRRISAETLASLLPQIVALISTSSAFEDAEMENTLDEIQQELSELIEESMASGQPLQGEHELNQSTFRATVVAQRVELSKQRSKLSKKDMAYSELVKKFHDLIASLLEQASVNYKDLYLHELLVYDIRVPQREAFTPKPRFIIERALSSPTDYLGCECCSGKGAMSATQPPVAILYQLYLESGALINVADMFSAFCNIVADQYDEPTKTALFSRAIAELKYLGLIKPSRKRVDHVAKLAWKGL